MADAGFFRGTTADQDNRFANKQKKLLKELNFSPILNTKLNMSKIDLESLRPWIELKIKEVLDKEDEILFESIYEHLAGKEPDGKNILVLITGFVDDDVKASKFMEELWTRLLDLQESSNGTNKSDTDNADSELKSKENTGGDEVKSSDNKPEETINNSNTNDDQLKNKDSEGRHQSSSSSHSATPPSRSVSKSPGNLRLDELSRGRPRRRPQEEISRDGSNPPHGSEGRKSRSRSRSSQRSQSGSVTPRSPSKPDNDDEPRRKSRSSSRSKRSGSRSRSRSYSRSKSRSRSGSSSRSRSRSPRSRSRSPRHRSRSPFAQSYRGRRSRSRDRGYRPRSRSPRGRRGFGGGGRGSYRGSYGYQDRRRGAIAPYRRRSPWGRRRFSPRSPPRRRRSPSFSPRRRRSPSPYSRRSRSRSPPGHMLHRNSPRLHGAAGGSHMDMIGGRHAPGLHHDMHRPMLQAGRIDYRGYGDGHVVSRHSPARVMNKPFDLPTSSHVSLAGPAGPPAPGPYSPPSSKKKHKKEKKHRKHKKSKKHRSASPETKKKKHKKHKKTKKSHKSH